MEYKILTSRSASELNEQVNAHVALGFKIHGTYHVVETFHQNRFAGSQLHSTTIDREYSQAMIKEE